MPPASTATGKETTATASGNKRLAENAADTDDQWDKQYGALVLYFTKHGHSNVGEHEEKLQELRAWCQEQQRRLDDGSLPAAKKTKLQLLRIGLPFVLEELTVCKDDGCNLFAPFNGYCHLCFKTAKSAGDAAANSLEPKKKKSRQKYIKVPFPLVGLRKRDNKNYNIKSRHHEEMDVTRDEIIGKLNAYVCALAAQPCTGTRGASKAIQKCDCMMFLRDKPTVVNAVSQAILDYLDLQPTERKVYAVERLRYADFAHISIRPGNSIRNLVPPQSFALPIHYEFLDTQWNAEHHPNGGDKDAVRQEITKAFQHKICHHAFCALHNIGVDKKATLKVYAGGDLTEPLRGIKRGTGPKAQASRAREAQAREENRNAHHGAPPPLDGLGEVHVPQSHEELDHYEAVALQMGHEEAAAMMHYNQGHGGMGRDHLGTMGRDHLGAMGQSMGAMGQSMGAMGQMGTMGRNDHHGPAAIPHQGMPYDGYYPAHTRV